jgi:hypothetical protein
MHRKHFLGQPRLGIMGAINKDGGAITDFSKRPAILSGKLPA